MVLTCSCCAGQTRADWERCGWCGAQRLLDADGALTGHRRLAGFWRRTLATLVDVALLVPVLALIAFAPERYVVPGETGEYSDEFMVELMATAVVVWFVYLCVSVGARGQTLGKRLLGLHVVSIDGAPVPYPRAAMREGVGKALELLLLVPVGLASWASLAFDERGRAVHDRLANTVSVLGPPVPRSRPGELTAAGPV